MSLRSCTKHGLHCSVLLSIIFVIFYFTIAGSQDEEEVSYGPVQTFFLVLQKYLILLSLPVVTLMFLGLVMFNAFPDEVKLRHSSRVIPFICIRTVTRGIFPDLVQENVNRNMKTCFEAGLENFIMEVVTDKKIGLPPYPRVREIVVPDKYNTKNGSLYKARALQYCLEESANSLSDDDWIVHLDEETVMTPNSVRGIINFVLDGKHQLGQGMISYANEHVVNWLTTLTDTTRVADDLGILKFQLKACHRLLLSWKGSFLVVNAGIERKITFDHGPKGSVTEDINFGMMAVAHGCSFDFIEGEMWEKSPFTLIDFIKQRSRWTQGSILITTNDKVPYKAKMLLCYATWISLSLPIAVPSIVVSSFCPVSCGLLIDFLHSFIRGVFTYTFIFGIVRSFSLAKIGYVKYFTFIIASLLVLPPLKLVLDTIAIICAICTKKLNFHIVDKKSSGVMSDYTSV